MTGNDKLIYDKLPKTKIRKQRKNKEENELETI